MQPQRVRSRIQRHLHFIGETRQTWELIWISTYSARSLALPHYVNGRVIFVGDAAHLVPIFGVRGLNSGFADAHNLGLEARLGIATQLGRAPAAELR